MKTAGLGVTGENIASNYLEDKGYVIHKRNFNSRFGEIDIIAEYANEKNIRFIHGYGQYGKWVPDALKEKGYNPLAYRYLALTAHYRSALQFAWEALEAAQSAYNNLTARVIDMKKDLTAAVLD